LFLSTHLKGINDKNRNKKNHAFGRNRRIVLQIFRCTFCDNPDEILSFIDILYHLPSNVFLVDFHSR